MTTPHPDVTFAWVGAAVAATAVAAATSTATTYDYMVPHSVCAAPEYLCPALLIIKSLECSSMVRF